jgi:predicted DNA-binding protein (UPF0251 family)/predicted Fe-Mo cluster-binding NifX family protein
MDVVHLQIEELEALRLAHAEQLYQEGAAQRMGISRPTFGRLLDEAHRKVTRALLEGLALRIEGGSYHLAGESCPRCEPHSTPHSKPGASMKIAVPILDESRISPHFGRAAAFLVFDTEGGHIHAREVRANTHGHHVHAGHEHGHGQHSHAGFLSLLGDCGVVISAGMGPGALSALQGAGMRVLLVRPGQTPEAAVQAFLEGRLTESELDACKAHH